MLTLLLMSYEVEPINGGGGGKNPVNVVYEWPLMQNISSEVTFDRQNITMIKTKGRRWAVNKTKHFKWGVLDNLCG